MKPNDRRVLVSRGRLPAMAALVGLALTAVACETDATGTGDEDVNTIGATGGTVIANEGQVILLFPPGAVAGSIDVTVEPVTAVPVAGLVQNTTFEFGPDGTVFLVPVALSIGYDPADVPGGVVEGNLRLHTLVGATDWQEVPFSTVDTGAHTVAGVISGFSQYGILEGGPPPPLTGEWNGSAATTPSLVFIVDVADQEGTLSLSAPISYGTTGTSLVGTGSVEGSVVTMSFDEFMGPTYWTFMGVLSGDGNTIVGALNGPGNPTTFPALTNEPLTLVRQ